ncbi:hypothetical protein RND71_006104 [Anisodus tanguticus]|uniref:Thionin-like protein 2 n=1 Tax=Anisodus tanguticus TaxID=243964 RepID=A0AAE1VNB0_9SOLA|nr:hypothetical protein RND71_006104 [Anisodus tanguticus]
MDLRKLSALVLVLICFGMFIGQSSASITSFRDCYSKCFVFCLMEPSQNLCTCTSRCLKECIFSSDPGNSSKNEVRRQADSKNLNFCKLGCAFSTCSALSTKHQPNGGKMDDCVGTCSRMCTKNYWQCALEYFIGLHFPLPFY